MSFEPPPGAELIRPLGAGSTFDLALVRHGGQERLCKRLTLRMVDEPLARCALEREVQILRRARHRGLPELCAYGVDDRGPYLVETRLQGATLRELSGRYGERGSLAPAGLVQHVLRASFELLAELHELEDAAGPLELVHGDLGPDHLLMDPQGSVFLVDFGQARWRGMAPELVGPDQGTLPFVAPEIARGERAPDQSSDVFALAATVAFLVLGREPCRSQTVAGRLVEVAERGLDLAALAQGVQLDAQLREPLLAALAYQPKRRLCRAAEVLARLEPSGRES